MTGRHTRRIVLAVFAIALLSAPVSAQTDAVQDPDVLTSIPLLFPGESNHQAGTDIIVGTLVKTAIRIGDWSQAVGTLGAEMLDVDLPTQTAYRSLFRLPSCKLNTELDPHVSGLNYVLLEQFGTSTNRTSIPWHESQIARRETALIAIADALRSRYLFNSDGNLVRDYSQDPTHAANINLRTALAYGIAVHQELADLGYRDETLASALGVARASLDRDGVGYNNAAYLIRHVRPYPSYQDALRATFEERLNDARRGIDSTFMGELCEQLAAREIRVVDLMRVPQLSDDFEQAEISYNALIKLVVEDLRKLERQ